MTDLDILGSASTPALGLVGSTDSKAQRLMQKVLILLFGPGDTGYDILVKLRENGASEDILQQLLNLGRQSVMDSLDLEDRLSIVRLDITLSNYSAPNATIDITLETGSETTSTTVTV